MALASTDSACTATASQPTAVAGTQPLGQRVRMAVFNVQCRVALARFEYRTRRAIDTNLQALHQILRRNRDTAFGRTHGFADILRTGGGLAAAFCRSVPLSTHVEVEPYVARIAAGEQNVLSADPVLLLAGSGGTTDRPKRIPRTRDTQRHHTMLVVLAAQAVVDRGIRGADGAERGINLMSLYAPPAVTRSSVPQMSGPNAGIRRVRRHIPQFWCSPEAVFAVAHPPTALYLHALFALLNQRSLYIETPFAPQVVSWLALIERHQRRLVDDVRRGTVSAHLELSTAERAAIAAALRADPARAADVAAEFAQGFQGIIPRLWPNMKYIRTVTSGSFALSLPRLQWLAGQSVTIHSGCHASTEGVIGINLRTDGSTDYVLALGSAFFEFVPIAHVDEAQPQTVPLDALQVGDEYEVVLTNCAGLCRYRLGDIVRITGHHGTTPTFGFLYRRGTMLNVVGEKTTEFHTAQALAVTLHDWLGPEDAMRDYSVVADVAAGVGRYTFYVELQAHSLLPEADVRRAATRLDDALGEINPYYWTNGRAAERLAPAELRLVEPGTFAALAELQLQRTGSGYGAQVKIPRVVSSPEHIQLLEGRVLRS